MQSCSSQLPLLTPRHYSYSLPRTAAAALTFLSLLLSRHLVFTTVSHFTLQPSAHTQSSCTKGAREGGRRKAGGVRTEQLEMLSFSHSPIVSYLLWCLVLLALASSNGVGATAKPKVVGSGYKLVSLVQLPNGGGLVGYLQVKQRTSTYGPDIPRLRLFVK